MHGWCNGRSSCIAGVMVGLMHGWCNHRGSCMAGVMVGAHALLV